jgi:hypothetical protein
MKLTIASSRGECCLEQNDFLFMAGRELDQLGVEWMLVGSFASSAWGEARFTQDIDIVVDLRQEHVTPLCAVFSGDDYYVSEAAARDAIRTRKQFNVIHPASGNKIDFMVARQDDWSRLQLKRARLGEIHPGIIVRIASPEDIIISKMRYFLEGGSDKHLRDCAGVLVVQGSGIDRTYISRWAEHFQLQEIWTAINRKIREVYGEAAYREMNPES